VKRDWVLTVVWVVGALGLFATSCVLVFIYPKYIALFKELGVTSFPGPTRFLMRVSNLLASKWWAGALLILVAGTALLIVRRTTAGRERLAVIAQRGRGVLMGLGLAVAVIGILGVPVAWVLLYLPVAGMASQLAASP
jgi:hypothetical protein